MTPRHLLFRFMYIAIAMFIQMPAQTTNDPARYSAQDSEAETALKREVSWLESSKSSWDIGYFVLIGVTALLVVVTFLVQLKVRSVSDSLSSKQKELDRLRELKISSLERESNELKQSAEGLKSDAERSKAEIESAKADAAEANKKSHELELARVKLLKELAWRRVGDLQHRRFVEDLLRYKGSTVVLRRLGDMEAGVFADDIRHVLTDAGWNIRMNFIGTFSPPPYGLNCIVDERTAAGKAIGALLRELPTQNVRSAPLDGVVAVINVDLKPQPRIEVPLE